MFIGDPEPKAEPAAFFGVFDALVRHHEIGELPDGLFTIYVSPLRALAYDLQKNLQQPLAELGWDWVRVSARTGDTPPNERAAQKRRPPHILVTTPESLTLLVSQPSWAPLFRATRFLIIDELHALAENKRGTLLMVAAERLEDLRDHAYNPKRDRRPLVRIGLSATVAPLDVMAGFLTGPSRACEIIAVDQPKPARIDVFSPLRQNPYPPAGWTGTRLLQELTDLLLANRTTLIFTNTRSGAESIGHRLKELMPDFRDLIEVHHASLDRGIRLAVEDRLKRGELRAVVCSTSLELGIDIGAIDTVVMVSAPKGVARALQRIGRSGHSMGETSHGVLVATNINDLAECAVTARMMARRELDPLRPHEQPLDVLAQHLVGLAVYGSTSPDEAYALVRRSWPYRSLDRARFDRVLRYLEGGGASLEQAYRGVFGKIRIDDGVLTIPSPRVARDFWQNVGTINTETMVDVKLHGRNLGQVEESFMQRLRPGDVFVLNGRSVRLRGAHLLTARVADAKHALPTIPRWYANKFPLGSGLAAEVVRLRTELARRLPEPAETVRWLSETYDLARPNAAALVRHFQLQEQISTIPVAGKLLIERYVAGDLIHYFVHALIGRSANDALSRIVAQRIQQTRGGNALATIDDYGFLLTLRSFQRMETVEDWRAVCHRVEAEADLRAALSESQLVRGQFRGVAQTGLMVPRRTRGGARGPRTLQWSSDVIFDVLRRHEPDHPLLEEAYAEATLRFLDLPRALGWLEAAPTFDWELRPVSRVSPFSFGIYVSRIKETMMLEDPETTIERLYHEMYGEDGDTNRS
ncbi:MAG TPA: DEAD/DEAH box helicase [Candidatus Synoicihabitans sp.]|nr:DEAD/DEAH box helicase [Candidatus Synoicihabitans sp.]